MLIIEIPEGEFYDENTERFIRTKPVELQLEHSLISLSKWESKWEKPFLDKKEKTKEELIDYVRCMTLNKNVDPYIYYLINQETMAKIRKYMDSSMTATWFAEDKKKKRGRSREIVTAEIIYYWMVALNIPFECQKWHLNRLITLVRVCSIKNAPPKKMSRNSVMQQNRQLNAARRQALRSKG